MIPKLRTIENQRKPPEFEFTSDEVVLLLSALSEGIVRWWNPPESNNVIEATNNMIVYMGQERVMALHERLRQAAIQLGVVPTNDNSNQNN